MWGLGGVKKNQNQTKPPRVEAEEPRRGITTRGGPHPTDLANTLPPWSSSGDHLQRTKRTEIGRYTLQTPPQHSCEPIAHHNFQNMTNEATHLQPFLQEANVYPDF